MESYLIYSITACLSIMLSSYSYEKSSEQINSHELNKQELINHFLSSLYKTVEGYSISPEESHLIKKCGGDPTYGEITREAVKILIDKIKPSEHDIFYDLGSGQGKMTIQMYLTTPVKKSIGIELSKNRFDASEKFKQELAGLDLLNPQRSLEFYNKNIADIPLHDATIVYISSLCFPKELIKKITDNIKRDNKNKLYLITLSALSDNQGFTLKEKLTLPMSWSNTSQVYIYIKN